MNNDILADFCQGMIRQHFEVYGIVIRQHGDIIANCRYREDNFVHMYSASKTFTAAAIGMAIDEGLISIDDKVIGFFDKEELPTDISNNLSNMTIYHLLTMTTGHAVSSLEVFYYERCENWIKLFFDTPVVYEPGTHFEYDNGATYILSVIIQRKTGMTLRDYLMPRLFDPLDIFNPQWDMSAWGYNKGYIGLQLTTEQLSRMGQLILNKGKWKGQTLIPEDYVNQMTMKHIDNTGYWDDSETGSGYGYQMWRCSIPDAYRLDGLYGQFCVILPKLDAVITLTCHQEIVQNNILRHVYNTIVPKIS